MGFFFGGFDFGFGKGLGIGARGSGAEIAGWFSLGCCLGQFAFLHAVQPISNMRSRATLAHFLTLRLT